MTSFPYSLGDNADFWLLGIGFIEISAIAGAIEIIVGILRTRAPGMSLDKMPVYAWAMLVFAGMIVFAFPPLILADALLELERSFQWPFFLAEQGGDPLLWQHLFWFFGHPEVYIIFLPAAAMVSMMLPTMAGVPLVGYRWVVLALVATGFLSFGLWVHHMYTTGLPKLSLSFFSAASMAVSIPAGIQVFAWIATMAAGRARLTVPMLFILGFLFIFVLGGLSGVMVAVVPFDLQVHDTYFVVAHLHYVLIGGMVFPLLGAFYYWASTASLKPLSERLGRWVFGLLFVGFNLTFFPMHITGLQGMPRRVYTYPAEPGWDTLNLLSTAGAFVLAAGGLLLLIDLALNFRPSGTAEKSDKPWNAGTLEWLPSGLYQARSIPIVESREPLWDQPNLAEDVAQGSLFLARHRDRTARDDRHQPGRCAPAIPAAYARPELADAAGRLRHRRILPPLDRQIGHSGADLRRLRRGHGDRLEWELDPGPAYPPQDIGAGIKLPVYATGPSSHSWWATVILLLVDGALFASLLFSYLFLWTVNPGSWPPQDVQIPPLLWPAIAAIVLVASGAVMARADRALQAQSQRGPWAMRIAMILATLLMGAALGIAFNDLWQTALRPSQHAYGAMMYTVLGYQGLHVAVLLVMACYLLARSVCGLLDPVRRASFDNVRLFWYYTVGQGLVALATIHLFPRLIH